MFVFQFQSKYLSITLYFCLFTFLNWRNSKHTTDVLWVKESSLRPKDVFISMTLQSRCQLLDSKNINSENLLETDFHFQQLKTLKPQNNQWFWNSLNCLFVGFNSCVFNFYVLLKIITFAANIGKMTKFCAGWCKNVIDFGRWVSGPP